MNVSARHLPGARRRTARGLSPKRWGIAEVIGDLHIRRARSEAYDEQAMPEVDSEALDFRAASESLAGGPVGIRWSGRALAAQDGSAADIKSIILTRTSDEASRGDPSGAPLRNAYPRIANGKQVKLVSNVGETILQAKLTPACARNQVIVYDGFEPLMHKNWYGQSDVEPGHVKHLGFASGYGHLTYRPTGGQPIPADRAVRVDVLKVN